MVHLLEDSAVDKPSKFSHTSGAQVPAEGDGQLSSKSVIQRNIESKKDMEKNKSGTRKCWGQGWCYAGRTGTGKALEEGHVDKEPEEGAGSVHRCLRKVAQRRSKCKGPGASRRSEIEADTRGGPVVDHDHAQT